MEHGTVPGSLLSINKDLYITAAIILNTYIYIRKLGLALAHFGINTLKMTAISVMSQIRLITNTNDQTCHATIFIELKLRTCLALTR